MNRIISWINDWIATVLIHCDKQTMNAIKHADDTQLISHEEIMKMFEED